MEQGQKNEILGKCFEFSQEDFTQRYIDEAYRVAQMVWVTVTTEGKGNF